MFERLTKWWRQRAEKRLKVEDYKTTANAEERSLEMGQRDDREQKAQEAHNLKDGQAIPISISEASKRAAAVLRNRAARIKQAESEADANPQQIIDPEVAEMIATASIARTTSKEKSQNPEEKREDLDQNKSIPKQPLRYSYKLPSVDLLEAPFGSQRQREEQLLERATIIIEKLKEFGVTGQIHRISPGPVATVFEFKPDPGIKASRVADLADDLCLALKSDSIRVDRMPCKPTVDIEVPNPHRNKVFLRELIESPRFQQSESKLTIALGTTMRGEEQIGDLKKLPHLLIASTTGSGKSVSLNSIICSILFKATPEEVRFIMVDPKRVELGLYEGIPHLLTPIISDPNRAVKALRWTVEEMEYRYKEFATLGVADLEQYNRRVHETTHPMLSANDPADCEPLPYIVIAMEGFADLIMVAPDEVETLIDRLAQKARMVGIHLVFVTQRPSVDVVTGAIKANIPSRIAFRMASKIDSRTVLDSTGAETLLGDGDMLFLPSNSARLIRLQSCYVSHADIKRIADYIRKQGGVVYNEQVELGIRGSQDEGDFAGGQDELFDEALAIVTDMGGASTSVLQRRLSIGYGRAAILLDQMERRGFIGPAEGSKPRKVLSAAYGFREQIEKRVPERKD